MKIKFVDKFPSHARREVIFNLFCNLLEIIEKTNVYFEVWIDGSFVTEKETPDDIDVSFISSGDQVDPAIPINKAALEYIFADRKVTKIRFLTDAIFVDGRDQNQLIYWKGCWGFSRTDIPKVFIRLEGKAWAIIHTSKTN